MREIALTLLVGAEFVYYLLIAQTGIVEYFHSELLRIFWLPLGGVIGTALAVWIRGSLRRRLAIFLGLQGLMTLQYPALSPPLLLGLGIAVGGMAPLMILLLRRASIPTLGAALGLSYLLGTLLFTTPPAWRGSLGILLTLLALAAVAGLRERDARRPRRSLPWGELGTMAVWVFLDSSLFETLSRDPSLSIWRGGYTGEIVLFHLLGVFLALGFPLSRQRSRTVIFALFGLSYLSYFSTQASILAALYPLVISYYNVVILRQLRLEPDPRKIALAMALIGWGASGAGLGVALSGTLPLLSLVALVVLPILRIVSSSFHSRESYSPVK